MYTFLYISDYVKNKVMNDSSLCKVLNEFALRINKFLQAGVSMKDIQGHGYTVSRIVDTGGVNRFPGGRIFCKEDYGTCIIARNFGTSEFPYYSWWSCTSEAAAIKSFVETCEDGYNYAEYWNDGGTFRLVRGSVTLRFNSDRHDFMPT
jgi:hypothetical protein